LRKRAVRMVRRVRRRYLILCLDRMARAEEMAGELGIMSVGKLCATDRIFIDGIGARLRWSCDPAAVDQCDFVAGHPQEISKSGSEVPPEVLLWKLLALILPQPRLLLSTTPLWQEA
jgi:hypothetical protein